MQNNSRKTLLRALAAAIGFSAALTTVAASAADPLKVGFVYIGPIGDHGWTYQHEQGRKYMEEQLGDKVKTSFVENVPEGADAERVIRNMAKSDYDLIFTTSFGYMNPTLKVAKQFPKVTFEHATGYKQAKNVGTYLTRSYEGRYVGGFLAAKMTKTKKVGQGVDVVFQHTDSPAPIQAAERRGVYSVGYASDMQHFGPKAVLTSIVNDWGPHYTKSAEAVMAGNWKSEDFWGGLAQDSISLPISDLVPADVKAEAEQIIARIKSGEFHPFTGPIKDQAGEVRIAEGETASIKDLASMNYYVQGVKAEMPK